MNCNIHTSEDFLSRCTLSFQGLRMFLITIFPCSGLVKELCTLSEDCVCLHSKEIYRNIRYILIININNYYKVDIHVTICSLEMALTKLQDPKFLSMS